MARILLFSCPTAQKLHKITYSETSYSILDREIAAMHWHFADSEPTNSAKKQRALALHGWLDNAASFSPMAGFLKNTELTAIDMAGQGKSDFRSRDGLQAPEEALLYHRRRGHGADPPRGLHHRQPALRGRRASEPGLHCRRGQRSSRRHPEEVRHGEG